MNGHGDVAVKLLADPRVDVNAADKDGYTPLDVAIKNDHDGIAAKLRLHIQVKQDCVRAAAMAVREADLAEQRAMAAAQLLLAEEDAKLSATVKISKSA